jgi:hypothetical protein
MVSAGLGSASFPAPDKYQPPEKIRIYLPSCPDALPR